ncbi:serine/threonine-protein kinase [Nonomuraea sp. NEAU-A123]|uniref:serine/threonine-protein kinase n=1 Tax=Nonomuraea sp. NEAU-A123 TaxID=2839649 RepID=UPI001BE3DF1C|nr:serine/threonine-protein kinase [Nonomuraea sp. NEAU-A123]MBT2228516.1 protein kinase [Nonomuraea sp. NEAU-A123]
MLGSGTTLNDRYTLVSRVGGGGMGEVWRASDTVLGRTVAVKVLIPALTEDPKFAQRFQNEARAMATLHHPGVVDVYDYGASEVDGRRVSFLVMQFVEGESLDRVLRREALDPATTMRLVAEVGDALAAAHAQGIVHRDVKPANLMIRPDGSVALTDFGIAHSVSAVQLTATGAMLCSAGYCAPEMATASDVTPAVDVYALGVVAYRCLTGHLPFDGDTPVQIIYKHLHAPVPALPDDVPPGPRQIVTRALEKTPERRWPTAALMAEAARRAFDAPDSLASLDSVDPPDLPPTPSLPDFPDLPPSPRGRRALTAALAVAVALLVSVLVAGSVWIRSNQAAEQSGSVLPPVTTASSTRPASATPSKKPLAPPSKYSPTARPIVSYTPTATATATPRPTVTKPTATPTSDDPKPTDKPTTTPKPTEPTVEPSVSEQPSDIQCIKEPCPS